MKKRPPDRKEDYFVMSSLTVRGHAITDVPCKVYLPSAPPGRPELSFHPSSDQFRGISTWHEGGFAATAPDMAGRIRTELSCDRVYFEDMTTTHWGRNVSECHLRGLPQDLRVVNYLHGDADQTPCTLVFWITPNSYLSPAMTISDSYTGDVECKRVYKRTFDVGVATIEFDRHFFSLPADKGESRRTSCLVGSASFSGRASDVKKVHEDILPTLDDFLLFCSLACRTRTACVGWHASDSESFTQFYRGFMSYPDGTQVRTLDRGLVDMVDFERFMAIAFSTFQASSGKPELRGAIYSLLGNKGQTVESAFLSMYAALEDLLLGFRKANGLEFTFEKNAWDEFKGRLQTWIKSDTLTKDDKDKRQHLYSKLEELNRIPARWAFEEMCRRLQVVLEDLWPVFDGTHGVTLSTIRNRLIHGGFPLDRAFPLATALDHLQWTLERIMLALFKWPLERSEVRPGFLARNATSMGNLRQARDELTASLRGMP